MEKNVLIEQIKNLEIILKHIRNSAEKDVNLFPGDVKDISVKIQKASKLLEKSSKDLAFLVVQMSK